MQSGSQSNQAWSFQALASPAFTQSLAQRSLSLLGWFRPRQIPPLRGILGPKQERRRLSELASPRAPSGLHASRSTSVSAYGLDDGPPAGSGRPDANFAIRVGDEEHARPAPAPCY